MEVVVDRIINRPVDSNSFILYQPGYMNCIVIDPGTKDCNELFEFFLNHKIKPEFIILSHEHFDHIWGVNSLKDAFNSKIICSKDCAERIINNKKNMSVFYDQVGFETYQADIHIEDINNHLEWNGKNIEFILTRGHSDGSICIKVDNKMFTGDTLVRNVKTVTKFPGGSRIKLLESLTLIDNSILNEQIMIHSGHGESFWYNKLEIQKVI